jgi:phage shock protein C
MFTGALAFWLYILAWVAIAPAPSRWSESAAESGEVEMEYDENRHVYRRKTPFRYTDAPSDRMKKVQGRMTAAVTRVEAMERYVTSRQYDLNREFSKL